MPWDKLADGSDKSVSASPSPAIEASAQSKPQATRPQAAAISDGEDEGQGQGEGEGEGEPGEGEEGEGEEDFSPPHFSQQFDPENPLDCDWSVFEYPVARDFVTRFREAHAIAAMFHLCLVSADKYPILNGQINDGWLAHYNSAIHVNEILKPPTTGEVGWEG